MHDQQESVRHLVELGYVDPDESAARDAEQRRGLQSQLQQAIELHRQGDGGQAAVVLERIVADASDWSPPHQLLAEIHYKAGRLSETQAELEWLERHGVDHARFALIRAAIALSRREMQTALRELEYAREVEPNLPSAHTLLGTVLLRLGRLDAAEDAFREAAQQNPADARARDGLAATFLRRGEYEDAADWALRALEQDMQLFSAHFHLGVALAHLNRPSEAVAALETSARLDSSRAAPHYWLSRIAAEQFCDASRADRHREVGRQTIRQRRHRSTRQRLL
jgi:tetratricopeptide (TPR) repeat protein